MTNRLSMKIKDVYAFQSKLKKMFILVSLVIVVLAMYVSSRLVKKLSEEEYYRMELIANATKKLVEADEEEDLSFILEVIQKNTTIPVVILDEAEQVVSYRNIDNRKEQRFQKKIASVKAENPPLEIIFTSGEKQYFYYGNSLLLKQLAYFPYVLLTVIAIFLAIVFFAFLSTKKSEQNRVWVGLSRETAHQLGTPISSLLAWIEILKEENINMDLIKEMSKDVERLSTIAERFSKIGSKPVLENQELNSFLTNTVNYIQNRVSKKIQIEQEVAGIIYLDFNKPLLEWVVENVCKNAVDAIAEDTGKIKIRARYLGEKVLIDISDSGKGIEKSKQSMIFNPGYTTKERGWGLGLSLVKRIIEDYHQGKIYVKKSVLNKGTTIRIILPM